MTERTLFDSTDDDQDAATEGQKGHPVLRIDSSETSSVESRGGAPCQDGAGESPAQCNQSLGTSVSWKCIRGTVGCTSPHDGITYTRGRGIHSQGPTDSLWRECPLEQFLAMTEHEQLDYCARRDEDSARFADNATDAAWYAERAAWYRRRMEGIR